MPRFDLGRVIRYWFGMDSLAEKIPEPAPEPQPPRDAGLEALRVIRHDFKTPLTSLRMLAQIFQVGLEKGTLTSQPDRTARNCQMLIDQVDKLVALADNLYDISLVQSGRMKLARQYADLRPILNNVITRYESKIRNIVLPEKPLWGEWDTARLGQALDYILAEAGAVEIVVDGAPSDKVVIKIEGDFKDVSEKSAPGRFIARAIIEAHGGKVEDHFKITLPLTPGRG